MNTIAINQETTVLLLIDLQRDFLPSGTLAVPNGDEVLPTISALAQRFHHVILTQDWHPANHISFAFTHPDQAPYTTIDTPDGPQTLWPNHCIQDTPGAALALNIPHAELILRKGFRQHVDSYSAFLENDHRTPTGLAGYLRERGLTTVFLAGLAYDFCVRFSAEDGNRLGFDCTVIEDACRPVALPGSVEQTNRSLAQLGIPRIQSQQIT